MTEQVTVSSVGEGKPWKDEITYWDVVFNRNGQDFACSWGKKGDGPVVGEEVEGEFFQKNNEWRFRKASKPPSGTPSSGSEARTGTGGGQGKTWQPESERDPERSARILRQHSQEMALRLVALAYPNGVPEGTDLVMSVFAHADQFDADVIKAGQAARQGQVATGSDRPEAAGNPPVNASSAPVPASPPADDTQQHDETRLDEALNSLGVTDGDNRHWLLKAWRELPTEKRTLAFAGLTIGDLGEQTKSLDRLREIAGPMPDSFKTDDIPF